MAVAIGGMAVAIGGMAVDHTTDVGVADHVRVTVGSTVGVHEAVAVGVVVAVSGNQRLLACRATAPINAQSATATTPPMANSRTNSRDDHFGRPSDHLAVRILCAIGSLLYSMYKFACIHPNSKTLQVGLRFPKRSSILLYLGASGT